MAKEMLQHCGQDVQLCLSILSAFGIGHSKSRTFLHDISHPSGSLVPSNTHRHVRTAVVRVLYPRWQMKQFLTLKMPASGCSRNPKTSTNQRSNLQLSRIPLQVAKNCLFVSLGTVHYG